MAPASGGAACWNARMVERTRILGPALVAALAGLLCWASFSAASTTKTDTASLGQVQAKLTYTQNGPYDYSDVHIQIDRAGHTVLDGPVPAPCSQCMIIPAGAPAGISSLQVVDLEHDGEPEVIVDLFTGGAHCCTLSVIYGYHSATDTYTHRTQDWRDPGYNLVDIDHDGRPEFRSSDARFAYEFTAYAFSAFPIQIWHYSAGSMIDVTKSFPDLVRRDAKAKRAQYRHLKAAHYDVRGAVAAYAADEYRLGRGAVGMRLVDRAFRDGLLHGPKGDVAPSGRKYIKRLRSFLRSLHYR
ncbi:MAG: hypothetical protein QOK25_1635 [Thermoleophilaceae bacterium]|nr:hypothetical protein [Thermoleophilaceae bacterium]